MTSQPTGYDATSASWAHLAIRNLPINN